ncbi:MAG: hypothetical protein PHS41_03270 [Victivallaceae bacterium]|nr:hypothetical protein [Victivallaceae bacterium]
MARIKFLGLTLMAIALPQLLLGAARPVWGTVSNPGAKAVLESRSPEAFELALTRQEGKTTTTIVRDINRQMPSQDLLSFRVRGSNDRTVAVIPILAYRDDRGKTVMKFGTKVEVRGNVWRTYHMRLDATFQLGDALFLVRQLKFAFNIDALAQGETAGVELEEIRLHGATDIGKSVTVRLPSVPENSPSGKRLKIYFSLDNDDLATIYRNRRRSAMVDANPDAGFRARLLRHVSRDVEMTPSLRDAGLIVYARTAPQREEARQIAAAVRAGSALLVCGESADPEIAELLPVTLDKVEISGFPQRKTLRFAKILQSQTGLSTASFGVYRRLTLRNSGSPQTLVEFSDGTAAVVEGIAGKGKVIYSTFSPGADLLPAVEGLDPFLLRLAGRLTGTKFPEKVLAAPEVAEGNWMAGASKENFGRFGFLLGDGLLTETMRGDLSVANESAEYAFVSQTVPARQLVDWQFREDAAKPFVTRPWHGKWRKIGKVELEHNCVIPSSWKGREIQFFTAKGIDDLAEVWFNGKLLGKTTRETPEYWMTPHCYSIPPELISFDRPNQIRIVSENLRGEGGFNSCPELRTVSGHSGAEVVIDRINWLGKGGVVTESNGAKRRFDTSLAFPGIRWEIMAPRVDLTLRDVAYRAAWSTPKGIVSEPLYALNKIPTEQWNAPWLLLYGGDYPLLLVFEHRPAGLEVESGGGEASSLRIASSGKEIGAIIPVWLFGKEPHRSEIVLPEWVKQIRFWAPKALRYPVSCEEDFRLGKRVEIRNRYRYRVTRDDWGTVSEDYAPVPQLAWQMRGTLVETDKVEEWPLATLFGMYAARPNSDTVHWSLPLPEATDALIARRSLPENLQKEANRLFVAGNRWSAGGRTAFDAWTEAFPTGTNYPECRNVSMHAWIMGLNQLWMAPWTLFPENQAALVKRTRIRFFEPVERFGYKAATRYREEPFSRISYPIFFNSFYRSEVRYAGRPASVLNYGDQNETAMMILSLARKLADSRGQTDFVRANWKFFREVARILLVSDDWGHLSCHCRESGEAATIDMLNCEYPSMLALARLAEIAGDAKLRDQAIYRAARRMVPVLARIDFADYALRRNLTGNNRRAIRVATGFNEEGAVFLPKDSRFLGVQLFDMSQGVEPDLLMLYRKYCAESLRRNYLNAFQSQLLKVAANADLTWENIGVVAAFGTLSREQLVSLYEKAASDVRLNRIMENDWLGIIAAAYLAFLPEK